MWMMGYNDGGDSFTGRKLRTIVPRPAHVINPSCLGRIHGTDLLSFSHHLAGLSEQSKREMISPQQVVVSSRWNPTPEQLQTLEELYRRGTRTPSAEEIQHITAQLRRYGKIEGKNVFYWFQNHKARERQKRRRQLESTFDEPVHNNDDSYVENTERKESDGANGTGIEVERTKNWASSTNCSSTIAEKIVSIQRTAKAAFPEHRAADHGWVQFDEAEFQQRKTLEERNVTWQMMQFSCSSSSSPSPTNNLINTATCAPTILSRTMDSKQTIKADEDLNIFITPYNHLVSANSNIIVHAENNCDGGETDQTLQLFPLRSNHDGDQDVDQDIAEKESMSEMNDTTITPYKFFEFLPLKN
ncbi:hypothetical protein ACH5RR_008468 [Cinchona calisaya]|uniref:Homeobox domain-containing protein n=1 Tax=Cinchona calisaya TaxID=153742 RepID=A0ABD3ABJ4_9GENT